ncbi:MAG: ATPase [Frankiales bacterium]|nr:ATPase [Frankiales bacterium]
MTVVSAASLADLQRPGVSVTGILPDDSWQDQWHGIVVDEGMKSRLLSFGLFCLTQRAGISPVGLPVHGLALLSGPPGTGKTTLAHGAANMVAAILRERGLADEVLFAVVDPHAFPSEFLGESQRAVARLFRDTLPELAGFGRPLIVLLDEVEALAVTRSRASLDTNPVDVHRATDAVLTGVDRLAAQHPNVVLLATTNDVATVDGAFLSRVDLHETFVLPGKTAAAEILSSSLAELGVALSAHSPELIELAARCVTAELDARRIRKLVLRALVSNGPELALRPETMTVRHVISALDSI